MPPLKAYAGELPYSYAPGVFPSLALMQAAPERATRLLLSERAQGEGIDKLMVQMGADVTDAARALGLSS